MNSLRRRRASSTVSSLTRLLPPVNMSAAIAWYRYRASADMTTSPPKPVRGHHLAARSLRWRRVALKPVFGALADRTGPTPAMVGGLVLFAAERPTVCAGERRGFHGDGIRPSKQIVNAWSARSAPHCASDVGAAGLLQVADR